MGNIQNVQTIIRPCKMCIKKQLPHKWIKKVVDWQFGASFEPFVQLLVWVEVNFLDLTIYLLASVWHEFPTLGSVQGS